MRSLSTSTLYWKGTFSMRRGMTSEEVQLIIDWHIAHTPQICAGCGHTPHHCNTVGGVCGVFTYAEGTTVCRCTSWPSASPDCSCGGQLPWLYYHGVRMDEGDPHGSSFHCSNDIPTDDPNRCRILDNKFFDGIEYSLILENGVPRHHWRCHKVAGHAEKCDNHNQR